jgi:hypothetical protein
MVYVTPLAHFSRGLTDHKQTSADSAGCAPATIIWISSCDVISRLIVNPSGWQLEGIALLLPHGIAIDSLLQRGRDSSRRGSCVTRLLLRRTGTWRSGHDRTVTAQSRAVNVELTTARRQSFPAGEPPHVQVLDSGAYRVESGLVSDPVRFGTKGD